jgi:flagellar hook-associated protein 1 FlgK
MANGSLGLSIGRSALQAHQKALEVTSQNLANANTPGYARKVVRFQSTSSLNLPDVQGPVYMAQIGTGVDVSRIEAVRDLMLNARIRDLSGDLARQKTTREVLDQVEALFTGEVDISRSLDDFFSALHDLAGAPDSLTVRSVVRARGEELTGLIRSAAEGLEAIRVSLAEEIASKATRINSISAELAKTNEQVAAMVSAGMEPNDFEDRRQVLLEELAEYADVQTVDGPAATLTILIGGQVIVQGFQNFAVQVRPGANDDQLPRLAVGPREIDLLQPRSGILRGLQDLKDGPIDGMRNRLNDLAITLAHGFNTVHRTGFGLDGTTGANFFSMPAPPTTETRLFSVTGRTFVPEPTVALDGLAGTIQPENFESNPIGQGAFLLNGRSITYNGAVDSLADIVARINASGAGVRAAITPENRLELTANSTADNTIATLSDSRGTLLERLGIIGANQAYPPASHVRPPTSVLTGDVTLRPPDDFALRIGISDAVRRNLNAIAAARGDDLSDPPDGIGDRSRGPGDGANALTLAGLREARLMSGGTGTFNEFYIGALGELGVAAGSARRAETANQAQVDQLKSLREEIQGVSIDEELINMIKFQRGFEAASRIINVMDQVLQTLIALGR